MRITRANGFLALALFTSVLAVPAVMNAQDRGAQGRFYNDRAYTASLRVNFEPTDADLFVDGRLVGRVSDFDGVFQRLRLPAGNHVITISRPGFRAERHRVYLERNGSETISGRLERVGGRGDYGRHGSIVFGVLPGDAQVWVNGSRRSLIRRGNAYALDLQPGRHRVEVRRAGYRPYYNDIDVRSGATFALNINWRR